MLKTARKSMNGTIVAISVVLLITQICCLFTVSVRAGSFDSGWFGDVGVDSSGAMSKRPSATTDSNGNLYIAENYYDSSVGKYGYRLLKSTNNGLSWTQIGSYASSSFDIITRNVAVDPTYNYIFLAGEEVYSSSRSDIVCYRHTSSGSGFIRRVIASNAVYHNAWVTCEYQYGGANYVYIAYEYAYTSDDRDLMFASSTNHGDSWSTKTLHGGFPDYDVYASPSITTSEGMIYIAYVHSADYVGDGQGEVWLDYSTHTDFSNMWMQKTHVAGVGDPKCRWPVVSASHGGGSVLVVFMYDYSSSDVDLKCVYSTSYGSVWSGTVSISSSIQIEASHAVTVDGQGSTSNSIGGYFHVAYYFGSSEYDGMVFYARAPCGNPGNWEYEPYGTSPIDDSHKAWWDSGFGATTQSRADGKWYPVVTWPDSRYATSDTDIYCTTPAASAHLTSQGPGGSNLGSISLDSTLYSLPNSVSKVAGVGTYQASYNPASGYAFDYWETANGVSVTDQYSNPTTVTFSNPGGSDPVGTLRARYKTPPPPPTSTVHLESLQDNSASSNLGTITFDGATYGLPYDVPKSPGSYQAQCNPEFYYEFANWETTSGVSVTDPNSNPTTVNVASFPPGGTLRARYKLSIPTIHLTSLEDNTATYNLGTTTFDGTTHTLAYDVSTSPGSYQAGYHPAQGYEFLNWETTSGVSVTDPNSNPTTVNVASFPPAGILRARYKTVLPSSTIYLSDFSSAFAANTVRVIYPSDKTPKPLGCASAMVSDWTASAFVITKLQTYTEGLDTDSNFVNQATGKPQGATGIGIVTFGGWGVNPVVKFAESGGTSPQDRAPIKAIVIGSMVYFQYPDGSNVPGASISFSVLDHDDMFLIEVYKDGDGRNMMICYGVGWKGTYAAGKYFHATIWPNLSSYSVSWIIVKWHDTNGDGFVNAPNDGDTYTIVDAGTSASYPSDKWERIWCTNDWGVLGSILGVGPNQPSLNFADNWGDGQVAYGKAEQIGFISSRTVYVNAGTWTFTIDTDDGVRLYIDGELVLDGWTNGVRTYTFDRTFPSAGNHRFTLEWFEDFGSARISFNMTAH